jgi:hypothetical protein
MKSSVSKAPFSATLTVNFESIEEYKALQWAMTYDETIPDIVYPDDYKMKKILSDILGEIHNSMRTL